MTALAFIYTGSQKHAKGVTLRTVDLTTGGQHAQLIAKFFLVTILLLVV